MVVAKIFGGHGLHLGGCHGAQQLQKAFVGVERKALNPVAPQLLRLVHHRVAFVHGGGDPLRLHAGQLSLADPIAGDAGDLGAQGVFHLLGRLAGSGHTAEHEQAGATARDHGAAAGAVGHAVFALGQRTVEPRAVVAVEHRRQHHERQSVAVGFGQVLHTVQAGCTERQCHVGLLGRGLHGDAAQALLRGLGAGLALGQRVGGQAAVILLGQCADLGHVHIACHHHGGVGGRVPLAVESARIIRCHGIQVAHPAHDRAAVGRCGEGGGKQLLGQHGAGLVFGAQAALFLDDLQLLLELVIRPVVVGKPVGFELHHIFKPVGRDLLVVTRVVAAGECVFAPAQSRHTPRELARRQRLGALEHHVLQHMGHTRGAVHLVHGAHAHPHHVHRSGGTPVGLHDELHAVLERELLRARGRGGRRSGGLRGGRRCRKGSPGREAGQQAQ
ncbi:hypothetical protein D3C71_936300 [compost metagenome]